MAVVKRLNINSNVMVSRKLIYTVVILKFIEVLFKVLRLFIPRKIFPYNMVIKLTLHGWWYGMKLSTIFLSRRKKSFHS